MKIAPWIQTFLSSLDGRPREKHPSLDGVTRLAIIPAVLAGLVFTTSLLAAEQSISVVDWKDAVAGSAPDRTFSTGSIQWRNCRVLVVGPETDPPSPMPGEQAVFVTSEHDSQGNPKFGIEAKPFSPEDAPAEGWLDFQVAVSKTFILQLGAGGSPGTSVDKENPYDGAVIVTFLITTPASGLSLTWTSVDGKNISRRLDLAIPQDTPFTLRVFWSCTPETIDFLFQIDGVDALSTKGMPVTLSIPNLSSATGIDYFIWGLSGVPESLNDASLFIGKISAGTQ